MRNIKLISQQLIVLSLISTLIACGSTQPTPTGTTTSTTSTNISFKNDVQPIFTSKCVICHQGGTPPGGLSLEPAGAYNNLVNVPSSESQLTLITPGAPDKSYLISKILGTQIQSGGSGAQMPYDASPLTQSQIDLISKWVLSGASNN